MPPEIRWSVSGPVAFQAGPCSSSAQNPNVSLAPHEHCVLALSGELSYLCPVSQHRIELRPPTTPRGEDNMPSVRRPGGILVSSRAMGELIHPAGGNIHDEDVEVPGLEPSRPCERDVLAIRVPGRV